MIIPGGGRKSKNRGGAMAGLPHVLSIASLFAALGGTPAAAQAPAAGAAPTGASTASPAPQAPAQKPGSVTCAINAQTAPPLSAPLAAARDLYRTGKFDESIAAYNAIIPSGGAEAAAAYAGLARVYLKQKRVADASAAAEKAITLTPDRAPAIVAMGEVYFRQGKLTRAEKAFLTPLMACNLDAHAYLGLRELYIADLDFKTADKYIRQAYRLDPGDPDIRREYLDTLSGQERIDFMKSYLASATNDDAVTHIDMQSWLDVLEGEKKEGEHACRLVSKVTQTETKLETLLDGPQRMRGVGLQVRVNDANAKLMLDTGASGILIDRKLAEKAGVKKIIEHNITGIGDKASSSGYLGFAERLQIGQLEFHDCYVGVVNSRGVLDDDGLIGADVFRSFLVDVNMPDQKFKLTQLPPFPDEPAAEASLQTSAGAARHLHNRYSPPEMKDYSPILLFGHEMLIPTYASNEGPDLFLIDSGSWDSMIGESLGRRITKVHLDSDTTIKGLNGKVEKVYRADEVTLRFSHFSQRRSDLVAFDLTRLSDDTSTEVSGILGFTLLHMLDMKIDYRDGLVNFTYDANRFH
jgi:tetratricopeptide (TPR) repeat protein